MTDLNKTFINPQLGQKDKRIMEPDEFMTRWDAVKDTNWGKLFHAYGIAEDTPDHLRNLTGRDTSLCAAAVAHLGGAVVHQSTIYTVTPVVVQVVAGLLKEDILREPLDQEGNIRLVMLLGFLGYVGQSLNLAEVPETVSLPSDEELDELFRQLADEEGGEDKGWGSPLMERVMRNALLELRAMAEEILASITPFISDENEDVRRQAMDAAAEWGVMQPGGEQTRATISELNLRLAHAEDREERAGLVLSLGKIGDDISRYLKDSEEAVRACAALFVRNPRADAVLIEALTRPDEVNHWFVKKPAFFSIHVSCALLWELLSRTTIEKMLPAAVAVIAQSSIGYSADAEWGPILQAAFPDAASKFKPGVRPPLPDRLTSAQRAVLEALVANKKVWRPRCGNSLVARMRVGLPDSRDEVAAYLRNTPSF